MALETSTKQFQNIGQVKKSIILYNKQKNIQNKSQSKHSIKIGFNNCILSTEFNKTLTLSPGTPGKPAAPTSFEGSPLTPLGPLGP